MIVFELSFGEKQWQVKYKPELRISNSTKKMFFRNIRSSGNHASKMTW